MIYEILKPFGFEKEVVKDGTRIHLWNKFESINPPVKDKNKVNGIAFYISKDEDDVLVVVACDSGYFGKFDEIFNDKFVEALKAEYDFNLLQGIVLKGQVMFMLRSNGFGSIASLGL